MKHSNNYQLNVIEIAVSKILGDYRVELNDEEIRELEEQIYYDWCKYNNFAYIRGRFNV